ncbi:MAG: hypothetical protein H0T83_06575 [Chthoniobacterales bacterium]|nr:hypothetical protein [Chthoniobacterales bacterium]
MAAALVPKRGACLHNSALMELGALVCLPSRPRCEECPVRSFCRATEPASLPRKRRRAATVLLTEAHAFTRGRAGVLLEQSRQRWRGMWILPRLPRAPKETPLLELDFPFTHHRVTLAVYARPATSQPNEQQKWIGLRELERMPLATPHRRALARLLSEEPE